MAEPKTAKLNKTVFHRFLHNKMSDDDDDAAWEGNDGAFPSIGIQPNTEHHVFTDEPHDGSFYSLEVVEEGSKEETLTGSSSNPKSDEFMSVSVSSSETPAIDNTAETKKKQQFLGIQKSSSVSSGGSHYPYNIYQSFKKEKDSREGEVTNNQGSLAFTRGTKTDREDASMPPQVTPLPLAEDSSVMTSDQQSQVMETTSVSQPPFSVMSTRSRRHGKRYTVRHTLSTNQQVNANSATMLKNIFVGIEQERHMHKLTAQHLRAVQNWLLFLPAILLSLLAGIVSLVFEADLKRQNEYRVYSAIFVGVIILLSVFWQAVSKQLDLGSRAALHDMTAAAIKRLSEDLLLTLSSTEAVPAEYVALIGEKFGQALDACPSSVPYKLETAFTSVSDRLMLMLKPPMGQRPRKAMHRTDVMRLYATAYDELATEIVHHWAWPFALPPSRDASEAALRSFKAIVTEGREVNKRKGCIQLFCPFLGKTEVEKSLFDIVPPASVVSEHSPGGGASPGKTLNDPYLIRAHMLGSEV